MPALRAPIIKRMANPFAGENFREAVGWSAVFPRTSTGRNVNVATGNLFVEPGVTCIRKIVDGIVEVEIIVVHAVNEVPQVVYAGHGEAAFDDVGMLEETDRGLVGAKPTPHGADAN